MGTIAPFFKTDLYELTMLDAAISDGTVDKPCAFEVFTRSLPRGRSWGVVAGQQRLMKLISHFFDHGTWTTWGNQVPWLQKLVDMGVINKDTIDWIWNAKPEIKIMGYPEGELFFPYSPILRVEGTFGQCTLLETLVLSVLNYDSAIASAASTIRVETDAMLIEMGSRRINEDAAVAAARAAYIGGFDGTSNIEASLQYNLPIRGTHAHAWVLAHENEYDAYLNWFKRYGKKTTVLIDTYDIPMGIALALKAYHEVFGTKQGDDVDFAIRIDSGDLREVIPAVRAGFKSLKMNSCPIVATGDLDAVKIMELENLLGQDAPETYGVGTSLVTGLGHPNCGFVYKLVELDGKPVAKKSSGKGYTGGKKFALRVTDKEGAPLEEILLQHDETFSVLGDNIRLCSLQRPMFQDGEQTYFEDIENMRSRCLEQVEHLEFWTNSGHTITAGKESDYLRIE